MIKERAALFIVAPHHQGGHSEAGAVIADALGVPYPIRVNDLIAQAQKEGADPDVLWPWLVQMRGGKTLKHGIV